MSSMTVRRGVVVGLGAAAGALGAAAFVSSAPIASADNTDFLLPLPAPAVPAADTYTYNDITEIGEGNKTVEYDTVYTGSGMPTTTTTTDVLPVGDTDYGYSTVDTSVLTLGTASYETVFESAALYSTTAAGSTFEFITPVIETISSF